VRIKLNVRSVFQKRAGRIREYLAERDLKALAILGSVNTIYVSGFQLDVEPWERPVVTLIPLDSDPLIILNELSINHYQYGLEKKGHWIEDVRYYDEHPRLTKRRHNTLEIPLLLSEALEERKLTRGRVGVDSSLSTFERWVRPRLPDLQAVDASMLLREMRVVKDDYELDLMRKAAGLTNFGQDKMGKAIKVGKSHVGIGHEVAYAMALEAAERYPSDYSLEIETIGFTGTGPEGAGPHGWRMPTGRKIQKGDSLPSVVAVRLNKYCVENERTYFLGKPTEKQKQLFEAVTEAQEKAIAVCVAGNKVSDIDAAALKVIEAAGFGDYVYHRSGHGIGLEGHEYWDDMAFNHRIMKAGMVTSVEPALFVYGLGGFRHSDTVIIGKDKPEIITKTTKRLEELTIPA
jgi:Xaa-Pro aminopeptidase/Xaa-Pro dipeptidase